VRFWDVSGSCLRLLYKLETASLFGIDTLPHSSPSTDDLTDDWPPFRKVRISIIFISLFELYTYTLLATAALLLVVCGCETIYCLTCNRTSF